MTVALRVDAADPTPPYEQLRRQLAVLIRAGAVSVGTRLPTVRQLAKDLATDARSRAERQRTPSSSLLPSRGGRTRLRGTGGPSLKA